MPATIKYDSTEILNTTYTPRFVKHETAPDRQLSTLVLARQDGEVLINQRYGVKTIVLSGILTGSSGADLESKIDTFKELFSRLEKNLDVDWNGGTLRFVATCTKHGFDRDHFNILFVPWTAEFTVLSGEGKDTSSTTALNAQANTTTTPATSSFTMSGSKPARPVIKLQGANFPSTAKGIQFENTDTGEKILATVSGKTWGTGYVQFDCDQKKVVEDVNASGVETEIDFYGVFPSFKIGTNNFKITVGTLINQNNPTNPSLGSARNITSTTFKYAQSFEVPRTGATFSGISVILDKTGNPGNITWRIETDNGNKPSGTLADAAATGTITAASVSTQAWYDSFSASNFTLNGNTKYWLTLTAAATLNGSNYYSWWYTSDNYSKGNSSDSTDSGSTYTDHPTEDFAFRVYFGGQGGSSTTNVTVTYTKTYL